MLTCPDCRMRFSSQSLLFKHQSKFCVGHLASQPKEQYQHKKESSESPRYSYDHKQRMRVLHEEAAKSEGNLDHLKSRNRQLQAQKEEIDKRLYGLHESPVISNTPTSWQIKQDLKRQEQQNEHRLQELQRQLYNVKVGRIGSNDVNMLPEIIAMRQAYLRQGGTSPSVLTRIAQLEGEARAMEAQRFISQDQKKAKRSNKLSGLNDQTHILELENQRLQNELLLLQERNNGSIEHSRQTEILQQEQKLKQQEYLQQLSDLEHEMEVAKKQAELESLRQQLEAKQAIKPQPRLVDSNPVQNLEADIPMLLAPTAGVLDTDALFPAPYDENGGFVIFYDFVLGLDMSVQCVRLVTCLHSKTSQYGQPAVLPNVYCESASQTYYRSGTNFACVASKQPVPRCPAKTDLSVVIELQCASALPGDGPSRLATKAWTKLDLFDQRGQVVSGRWRLPLRVTPIQPHTTTSRFNSLPQFGAAELYIRVVNDRDSESQSMVKLSLDSLARYTFPAQATAVSEYYSSHRSTPQEVMSVVPASPDTVIPLEATPRKRPEFYDYNPQSRTVGFQIDRIKHAEQGLGKIRITAYYKNTGKIVQSATGPVTCSTTAVKSNFKYKYHVFGQQEATFHELSIQPDIVIVARFYLRKESNDPAINPALDMEVMDPSLYDNETLVAWGTMPLYIQRADTNRMNVGTHLLNLFLPPVPNPNEIPLTSHGTIKDWKRYNERCVLRLHVFQGAPRPGSLTPSEDSEDDSDMLPEFAWIPHKPSGPPKKLFTSTDGFDVYIDGCRHLPDSVTVSRIAGRCLSSSFQKNGRDINSQAKLNSDIYNPVYDDKIEFREPTLPATLTLLLKIYTIDKFYKKLTIVGYSTVNIFVETGTYKQPKTDSGGVQISLNEGGHQLRVYAESPDPKQPLTSSSMEEAHNKLVPCASVLVRIVKAPTGRDGRPLEQENYPQEDWARLGLHQILPDYNQRVYYSMKCKPSSGEVKLLQTMALRTPVSCREAARMIADEKEIQTFGKDNTVENFIRTTLTNTMDDAPLDIDLTYLSQYNPKYGIKIAVDSAMNLPWTNFTHATVCLNPPGAFYMGQPQAAYDKLKFSQVIAIDSTNSSPEWKDPYFSFPNRSYHKYMTVIIHLQEISMTVAGENYKYGLLSQAWTAIQVFKDGFACTAVYQLPLFYGPPKPHHLRGLAAEPCKNWVVANARNRTLKPVPGASVFVRLCDGRRHEELPSDVDDTVEVKIDESYLPKSRLQAYKDEKIGRSFAAMVLPGKSKEDISRNLGQKFKSLVYKQYEETSNFE